MTEVGRTDRRNRVGVRRRNIGVNRRYIGANRRYVRVNRRYVGVGRRCIGANRRYVRVGRRDIGANRRCVGASRRCVGVGMDVTRRTGDSLGEPGRHSGISAIPNPPDTGHVSGHQPQENGLELSCYETNSQSVCATNLIGGLTEDNAHYRPRLLIHQFQWGKQSSPMMPRQSDTV